MFALINSDYTLYRLLREESVEWNGRFWNNLRTIDPEIRKTNFIYDAIPSTGTDQFHTVTELTWVVNQATGTVTETLTTIDKSVSDALNYLWPLIQQKRDILLQTGGCKVNVSGTDYWFHSDTYSKIQQMALVQLGTNIPPGLQWKTMSGEFVTMTTTLANSLFTAQVTQDQAIFAAAQTHYSNLTAMSDVTTMAAYNWNSGWPETYLS